LFFIDPPIAIGGNSHIFIGIRIGFPLCSSHNFKSKSHEI